MANEYPPMCGYCGGYHCGPCLKGLAAYGSGQQPDAPAPVAPANHTQRIAAVREAVQERLDLATGYKLAFEDHPAIWPCVGVYVQFAIARLAADLEHLAEHETAEAEYRTYSDGDCLLDEEIENIRNHWQRTHMLRAQTKRLAAILGVTI